MCFPDFGFEFPAAQLKWFTYQGVLWPHVLLSLRIPPVLRLKNQAQIVSPVFLLVSHFLNLTTSYSNRGRWYFLCSQWK